MAEAIILLRKKYKMPVISIYGKKDNDSIIVIVEHLLNIKKCHSDYMAITIKAVFSFKDFFIVKSV